MDRALLSCRGMPSPRAPIHDRAALVFAALACALPGCTSDFHEDPTVVPAVDASCGVAARRVTNVCTKLGPDDGCAAVDDVCVALCDQATSCSVVDPVLRVLSPWPVAPAGYCVVCTTP